MLVRTKSSTILRVAANLTLRALYVWGQDHDDYTDPTTDNVSDSSIDAQRVTRVSLSHIRPPLTIGM